MLKVAIISPLPPQQTGESSYTLRLIKELSKRNDLEIIAVAGREALDIAIDNVRVLPIWEGQSMLYPMAVFSHLSKLAPDIVHVQFGPYGKIFGGLFGEPMLLLLMLLRLGGFPTTITLHSTWMPHQVLERSRSWNHLGKFGFLSPAFFRLYMRLLDKGCTTIQISTVTINSRLRESFLEEYRMSPEKVLEIPHPFRSTPPEAISRERAQRELGLKGDRPILIFGFIRPDKGINLALDALTKVRNAIPNVKLIVAGKPKGKSGRKYLEEVKKKAQEQNLKDNLKLDAFFIPEEKIPLYFNASEVLLIPYTESVGASGPIHNYASFGTPIVAANVGYHMAETLNGNLTVFQPKDPNNLAEILVRILTDKELANKMGRIQKDFARKENWALAADRTIKNYQSTLEQFRGLEF
jgi:glycosyltransferase involved in cell wall biosynthesis